MNSTSAELREWAARCEDMASSARTQNERMSLLRKAEGLRALANSEDWLAGREAEAPSRSQQPSQFVMRSLAAE